jgi:hypothetical protein
MLVSDYGNDLIERVVVNGHRINDFNKKYNKECQD